MRAHKLALILHAHLPYVRQDHAGTLEERWLYEALTETYIPLLQVFHALRREHVPFRITLSVTPTLAAMLDDRILQERYLAHLDHLIELAQRERERIAGSSFAALAAFYAQRLSEVRASYTRWNCELLPVLRDLQEQGHIELLASAATHGFLPYMQTPEAVQAQVTAGRATYAKHFGRDPSGFWLPECAYAPTLLQTLAAQGIRYIFLDSHSLLHADSPPTHGEYSPVSIGNHLHAFVRHQATSQLVWNAQSGYPGDSVYREYYRDIGWDLGWQSTAEWSYIKPYLLPDGARIHTGIKYYRITGRTDHKEIYDPQIAKQRVAAHAEHFLSACQQALTAASEAGDLAPQIVAMYDAELFGHWWYEGPEWIAQVLRKAAAYCIETVSPKEVPIPTMQSSTLGFSSWGRGGYGDVWVNETNQWTYRHLHAAERRLTRLANQIDWPRQQANLLSTALKHLLLAQSSDWHFILDGGTFREYATNRITRHLLCAHDAMDKVEGLDQHSSSGVCDMLDESLLPAVSYSAFRSHSVFARAQAFRVGRVDRICMLTWEYPPHVVGGLGKSVSESAAALVRLGEQVHVVTVAAPGLPDYECRCGVHVHRVEVAQTDPTLDFADWVFLFNIAVIERVLQLEREGCSFSLVHAHDWLVGTAARELHESLRSALITTIHATEYGRSQGKIESPLQRLIHAEEEQLVQTSDRIFVCSHAMCNEVQFLFNVPRERISVHPNGVSPAAITSEAQMVDALHKSDRVLFIGRLVHEKGTHILVQAMRLVLARFPNAQLLIAGRGPMQQSLQEQSSDLGDHVYFLGFVDPPQRERLLRLAAVTVVPSLYEPFGLVALEAMQVGCPVVVSDTGGLAEIVTHGVDGLTAITGHAESLAEQICYVLADSARAVQMAERARRKVLSLYDWTRISLQMQDSYALAGHHKLSAQTSNFT